MTSKVIVHCPYQKDHRIKVEIKENDKIETYYIEPGSLGDSYIWGGRSITISEEPIAYAYPATNLGT